MLNQTIKNVKMSRDMIVSADKSQMLYKVPVPTYQKMLRDEVTKKYRVCSQNEVAKANKEFLEIIESYEPGLETRIEVFSQGQAFITFKDHKPNFPSKIDVRLLNPAKPQIGKVTKVKLQEINQKIRSKIKLNQLQSTNDAISWFNSLKWKNQRYFLMFDIISFYPSITEEILKKAFNWARTITKISKADEIMVFVARRSFLFINDQPWVKKENSTFDMTMGSFDGAEVAEFVGLFLLHKLSSVMNILDFALYRDDGICAIRGTKRSVEDIRKKIEVIFKEVKLQIEVPTGPTKSVDFFDLNLNLMTGYHAPYRKPLSVISFISKHSNHPNCIKAEVPRNAAKRISTLSSNERIFNIAKVPYIEALKRDGYENVEFKYQPKQKTTKPKTSKNVLFCNLPWNMAVKINVGKEFLSLLDMFKGTPQGKQINRHKIKLSYSTMKNLSSHITASNLKRLKPKTASKPLQDCNCPNENIECPVDGQCMISNVVYEAEIKTQHSTKSYIGMTGCTFITRWKEHRGNLRYKHQKGTKLSNFVWKQKDFGKNIEMKDIKWSLKAKTAPYKAGARFCDTCLSEKTHIALANPSQILNSRKEIVSKCPHKRDFKLKFFKPP